MSVTLVILAAVIFAVVMVVRAYVLSRPVPLAAVAVLVAVAPGALFVAGLFVTFASSDILGEWMLRAAVTGLGLAALALAAAIIVPRRRRMAKTLCVLALATLVPGAALGVTAATADGRHRSWLDDFPAAGSSRPATPEERRYVAGLEYHLVVRTWDQPGIDCNDLRSALATRSTSEVVVPDSPLGAPGAACHAASESAWRGAHAAVTPDGRLIVAAWSPTAELFVF